MNFHKIFCKIGRNQFDESLINMVKFILYLLGGQHRKGAARTSGGRRGPGYKHPNLSNIHHRKEKETQSC